MSRMHTPAHIAYHEAGHFVASVVVRPDVVRTLVSITPHRVRGAAGAVGTEELVYYPRSDGQLVIDPEQARRAVLVDYAGREAQLEYDPGYRRWAKRVAASDDKHADEMLGALDMSCRRTAHESKCLRKQARMVIRKHWPAVVRLAEELVRLKDIDGDEGQAIVETALGMSTEAELERYRALRDASKGGHSG